MSIFQKVYDWLDFKTPIWLKALLREVQDILISILWQIGQNYIDLLSTRIKEVSKRDWSNRKKFESVYSYARELGMEQRDHILNLIIEFLVARLKKQGAI